MQWGFDLEHEWEPPTTFELSVLLTTPHPSVAARWLDAIPLKLPDGLSRTGLERTVVDAERYLAPGAQVVAMPRDARRAPFNYARDKEAEFDGMWAALSGFV